MTYLEGVVRPGPRTDELAVLLSSHASAGELGLVEMEMAAGATGPPLHLHPTHGEGFYVLAGDLSFQVGDDIVTGGPGTWVFAPRGAPHTLANHSERSGRVLCVFAPGGFERRFERMIAEASGEAFTDERSEAELATQLIGPPMSAPGRSGRGDR
jgi:quercetin dioxygenase-like cupin family protein